MEARITLGVESAGRAASRITASGASELQRLQQDRATGDPEALGVHRENLHTVIADLAGNRIMALLVRVLIEVVLDLSLDASTLRADDDEPQGDDDTLRFAETRCLHKELVASIIAGDAPLARHFMARHLAAGTQVLSRRPGRVRGAEQPGRHRHRPDCHPSRPGSVLSLRRRGW